MKSNECILNGNDNDIAAALREVEKVAAYNKLTRKEAIQLRLLAEELMGMQKGILGFSKGKFYIENKKKVYNLYLHSEIRVDMLTREKFVELASSKKNTAYGGFMGKVRMVADKMLNDPTEGCYIADSYIGNPMVFAAPSSSYEQVWALSQYREEAQQNASEWDELEKSIVASIADEVVVGARTDYVDLIAVKKF